ncbi:MAG: TCR/Tet family MFS transporter [Candidatus Sericytochromatia bacterium]|nr:TCR/Tet family MFS transporter [Candidatus Sericytochromatia bacterium]
MSPPPPASPSRLPPDGSGEADHAPRGAGGRAPALTFIFIAALLDIIGIGIVVPVMPRLVAELGAAGDLSAAAWWVGLSMTLYTSVQFLCAPLLGALSDQWGRKPVLLATSAVAALGYFGTAWAPTLGWYLASRALGGFGGASLSVATAYIADVTPPEKRAQGFGMIGAAFGLGFILGPAIGGLLGASDMRLPFLAAAAVCAANFLFGLFVLPESHRAEHRRPFTWGAANPLRWVATLRQHPVVAGLAIAMIWQGLGHQCLQSNWALYTAHRYQWTPRDVGVSLACVGLGAAVVQGGLIRVLLPRLGERRAIVGGLSLSLVAMILYGLAPQGWMIYPVLVVASLAGIAGPAMQAQVSARIAPHQQGAVQGSLASLMSLTGVVGPVVANAVFGFATGPSTPVRVDGAAFFLGATLMAIGLMQVLRVFRREPAPRRAEAA